MEKKKRKFDGWVECCFKCPNKEKPQDECFEGKSYDRCPKYNKAVDDLKFKK